MTLDESEKGKVFVSILLLATGAILGGILTALLAGFSFILGLKWEKIKREEK